MGIEPPGEFGNDCNICFNPNETPKYIEFSTTGIKQGDNWDPSFPGPPNGTQRLTQEPGTPCFYTAVVVPWNYQFRFWPGNTFFFIDLMIPAVSAFLAFHGICAYFATNSRQNPINQWYYGGNIQVWIV